MSYLSDFFPYLSLGTMSAQDASAVAITGGTGAFTTLSATVSLAIGATSIVYLDGVAANGDTYLLESSANVLDAYVGGVNALRLSATQATVTGKLSSSSTFLRGNNAARSMVGITSGGIYQEGTNNPNTTIANVQNSAGSAGPLIILGKSRGAAVGGIDAVQTNDRIGAIYFCAADGTDIESVAAYIECRAADNASSNSTPGNLGFFTNSGNPSSTERFRINSSGDLSIVATEKFYLDGLAATGDTYLTESSANVLDAYAGGVNTLKLSATQATVTGILSSSGVFLRGNNAARSMGGVASTGFYQEGTDNPTGAIASIVNAASSAGPILFLGKTRSAAVGGNDAVLSGDRAGAIFFSVSDGTDIESQAAFIDCRMDANAGPNDTPGRLTFNTTSVGASSATERFRINSAGNLSVVATEKFYLDGLAATGDTYFYESAANTFDLFVGGTNTIRSTATAITITGTLTASGDAGIAATKKIYLDGVALTGNTYLLESAADTVDLYANGLLAHRIIGGASSAVQAFHNDTSNANSSSGFTLNQGAFDDEILSFKSSDVAHGITTITETDTYGYISKNVAANGGVLLTGLDDTANIGLRLRGISTTTDGTFSTAGLGAVIIDGALKSGTGLASLGANKNILAVRDNGTMRFSLDTDGDSHQDVGTAWTNFDHLDDVDTLNILAYNVSRANDPIKLKFGSWVQDKRDILTAQRIVKFNDDGHHFVNMSRLTMLHTGAIRQLGERIGELERKLSLKELN